MSEEVKQLALQGARELIELTNVLAEGLGGPGGLSRKECVDQAISLLLGGVQALDLHRYHQQAYQQVPLVSQQVRIPLEPGEQATPEKLNAALQQAMAKLQESVQKATASSLAEEAESAPVAEEQPGTAVTSAISALKEGDAEDVSEAERKLMKEAANVRITPAAKK